MPNWSLFELLYVFRINELFQLHVMILLYCLETFEYLEWHDIATCPGVYVLSYFGPPLTCARF